MFVDFLLDVWREHDGSEAIVWREESYSYGWLLARFDEWRERLASEQLASGTVVILEADFSPNSVALFVALAAHGCIVVPLTSSVQSKKPEFVRIAEGEISLLVDERDEVKLRRLGRAATHSLYQRLREAGHPGLVLFSSGSTGESKAALHDLVPLLEKFRVRRQSLRTISFLLYDHIGGVNTMLYTLSNGGTLVTLEERTPDAVLSAVERQRVELLPTSPTFLNLVLMSEAYRRYDLRSLKTVTYGTEPMPEQTLRRFHALFPHIRLQQTYGLSEVGILRSKSKESNSLWVRVGGEGFETRIVDGILQIKAQSAMLGYLNAPSPFTEDGWLVTGDTVETDGEYLRILGRKSEIINVGGEKVYPAEVESVVQELDGVAEVAVYGEKHLITGQIVCARIAAAHELEDEAERRAFVRRVKQHCRERLQNYKVPVKVELTSAPLHTARFKKARI